MKVIVINLEKDTERRKGMEQQFNQLEIEVDFLQGYYGKNASELELEKIANRHQLEQTFKRTFDELKGLIGCTYSHYLCYQKMINEGIEVACILEDDVILSDRFMEVLNWAKVHISSDEVISLHTLLYFDTNLKPTKNKHSDYGIFKPEPPAIRGTQGYIITLEGAKRLSAFMLPIVDFPDCWHRYKLNTGLKISVLFPFPLRHMWIDSVRDIGSGSIKSKIVKFIQYHQIFPLWQIIISRRRTINDIHIRRLLKVANRSIRQLYLK